MTQIVWLPSMSVGIDKWDADHKVLLKLINRLDLAVREESGADAVRQAIDALIGYADIHFRIEETAMERLGYPMFASHKADHDRMRAWIAERQALAASSDDAVVLLRDMAEHLVHWLYTHVLTIDMRYTDFFDENRRKLHEILAKYKGLELQE